MISYIGGKMRMADWISGFVPECETYVEVFGGAYWVYINSDFFDVHQIQKHSQNILTKRIPPYKRRVSRS